MDITYLLFLQNLRNGVLSFLAPAALWFSDLAISFFPICVACLIYWVADRKNGKNILFGFGLGLLINGLLKLIFCVYRPWIRDSRVEPYGDSKVTATGYSFPSGHSTWATTLFGGEGFWFKKKKNYLCILFFATWIFVLFTRNFLGVHTPQDVLVGMASSLIMMYVGYRIEKWTDEDPNRDKAVLIGGLVLCVVLFLFYHFKSYPLTYLEDGSLLVDPVKMQADSFEGIGFISSYVIWRYFERRNFHFDEKVPQKTRIIVGLIACVPLALWCLNSVTIIEALVNRPFAKFTNFFVIVFYALIVVPWIFEKFCTKKEK